MMRHFSLKAHAALNTLATDAYGSNGPNDAKFSSVTDIVQFENRKHFSLI